MKILSIEFVNNWSWGLVFNALKDNSDAKFNRVFMNHGNPVINSIGYDIMFAQNVTLLKRFTERLKTVCRMGGNQNFESGGNIEPLLKEMSKCFCIVATNQKLFDIASAVNERVYLIPNGINLQEWETVKRDKDAPFTVGFCGNITTPYYREYKGYDFVKHACNALNLPLEMALYQEKQLPHHQMREKFYSNIDCIVHPTTGEGCSNTLMESAACGVPIITTRCAGYHGEQMIDGENVLFCDRTNESVLDCIQRLKDDSKLRKKLSKGARKFAESNHDIKKIAAKYSEIFKECHAANAGKPHVIKILSTINRSDTSTVTFRADGGYVDCIRVQSGLTNEQIIEAINAKINTRK